MCLARVLCFHVATKGFRYVLCQNLSNIYSQLRIHIYSGLAKRLLGANVKSGKWPFIVLGVIWPIDSLVLIHIYLFRVLA